MELGEFLGVVAHHARRDLWSQEAVEWGDEHVAQVLETVKEELALFLEVGDV